MKIVSVFGSSVEKLNILGMVALDLYITVLPFNHMVAHKDKPVCSPGAVLALASARGLCLLFRDMDKFLILESRNLVSSFPHT